MRLASTKVFTESVLRQVWFPVRSISKVKYQNPRCGCEQRLFEVRELNRTPVLTAFSETWFSGVRTYSTETDNNLGDVKSRVRSFDQVVYRLQADIRRKRRIHKAEIHNAVELYEAAPRLENFGDFLISCCCDVLPDLDSTYRVKLALRVWSVIEKNKGLLPEHFEALLKVLAMNEDKNVNPLKLLEQAKSAEVKVTGSMYYFAMLIACQRGDLEGAVQVLDIMKLNEVPVNERFFNALILGNFRTGDYQGALDILGIMKASQIEPGVDTWSTLLQIHIEKGDLNGLLKTYADIGSLRLPEDVFYNLLKVAGMQEDEEITKTVINWALNSQQMYLLTVTSLIRQLTHSGHPQGALLMVIGFESILRAKQEPLGAFFIKDLHTAKAHTDPGKYLSLVSSLQNQRRNPFAYNIAAESCLKHQRFEIAFTIFDKMLSSGLPVRPHYFLPAFLSRSTELGTTGGVSVLKRMIAQGVPPDWDLLVDWIIPTLFHLERNLLETLKIVKEVTNLSYASGGLVSAGLIVALQERQVNEGLPIVERVSAKVTHPSLIIQKMVQYICDVDSPSDLQAISKYIKYVYDNRSPQDFQDYVGQLLVKLSECDRTDEAEAILQECISKKVTVSQEALQNLQKFKLNFENLDVDDRLYFQQPRNAELTTIHTLECHQEELTSKGLNARGNMRRLFLKYCSAGDMEKVMECSKSFEKEYGALSTGMKAALMGAYIKTERLKEALRLFDELTSEVSDVVVDIYKIIDLGTLLAKNGKVEEAVQLVGDMCQSRRVHKTENISRNIINLLEAISKSSLSSEFDYVFELTELFLKLRLMLPKNPTLGPSIRDLIRKNNLVGAVERLELYSKQYKACPCLQELTYKVLNDEKLLDRVAKCSASVKGEIEAKRLLGLAKADVGDVDGAARCFLELGNNLSFVSLIKQCEYLMSRNEVDKVLSLISAIQKTGLNYDCRKLYETALRACKRQESKDSLKKLIASMEEQDIHVPQQLKEMSSQR